MEYFVRILCCMTESGIMEIYCRLCMIFIMQQQVSFVICTEVIQWDILLICQSNWEYKQREEKKQKESDKFNVKINNVDRSIFRK